MNDGTKPLGGYWDQAFSAARRIDVTSTRNIGVGFIVGGGSIFGGLGNLLMGGNR